MLEIKPIMGSLLMALVASRIPQNVKHEVPVCRLRLTFFQLRIKLRVSPWFAIRN
jgi:hypothetical protein